jgi:hypothetical protein
MTYSPFIPQATDELSVSQPQLLANFTVSNSSFGIDHYPFADISGQTGKHNQVTTPVYVNNPPTMLPPTTNATEPKFYGFQDSAPVGVIQYSRGPNNAIPSPVTNLQSPSTPIVMAPNTTINILDFAGLARAFCLLYAGDLTNSLATVKSLTYVVWTGSVFTLYVLQTNNASSLFAVAAGTTLQLKSAATPLNNVYWTLDMKRLS